MSATWRLLPRVWPKLSPRARTFSRKSYKSSQAGSIPPALLHFTLGHRESPHVENPSYWRLNCSGMACHESRPNKLQIKANVVRSQKPNQPKKCSSESWPLNWISWKKWSGKGESPGLDLCLMLCGTREQASGNRKSTSFIEGGWEARRGEIGSQWLLSLTHRFTLSPAGS